jgi:membrane protease YdiL (CAAX protease family)
VRDAASFGGDNMEQSFVELEGGGKAAFASLLRDDLFSPYTWSVRLFKESETHQTVVRFKPDGQPYGFTETLREQAPGAALAADAAREIAERAAAAPPWNLPLDRFTLAESSQEIRPGGRVDHSFIYERTDLSLGEGRLRLTLVVSGDRLTALTHFIKIPEAFSRRFEQMRSANNAIAGGASVAVVLLYVLGGCGFGIALLVRQRAALWRPALAWAGIIAGFQLLAAINAWPLEWLGYDTALSGTGFIMERFVLMLVNAVAMGFVFFVSFLAAEGLSRRAFPHHPQFWKLWSRDAASTRAVLGRTLGGYLLAAFGIVYVSVFYFIAFRQLGWWTPSEALVNPDSLAHYWPWLTPVAQAAQAGFWEESLFRAVPLAGAALLGTHFGGRRWWIAGAFVLQAIVFAAAHANYPGMPAYSRLVELMVPSFVFGALFLRFGLLPAIVLHFIYDVVLMALPLFAATADGVWLDRLLVVLLALAPLWIVLWRRRQTGALSELPATLRNGAWQPPVATPAVEEPPVPVVATSISSRLRIAVICAGIAGLLAWLFTSPLEPLDAPIAIDRTAAIDAARAELTRRGVELSATHRADASVPDRPWEADRFAWQTAGREGYDALIGSYLPPPRWAVRFATFTGDVAERAEEWTVVIGGDSRVLRVQHKLPEARAGMSLSEDDARERVHTTIRERWGLDPLALTQVSATSEKLPNRVDWTFVFRDPAVKSLQPGEARIQVIVAGDEVVDAVRFVFAPEEWERADRAKQSVFRIGRVIKGISTAVLVLTGIGIAIVSWSRKKFATRVGVIAAAISAVTALIAFANQWPGVRAGFSTAQPLQLQQTTAIVLPLVGILISAAGIGLVAGLVVRWLRPAVDGERDAALLGGGIGAAVTGALAAAALLRASAAPPWPAVGIVGTFSPWIASVNGTVSQLLTQSLALLLVAGFVERLTNGWQRRRALGGVLVFLLTGILLIPWGSLTVASWLILTLVQALIATLAYLFVLRRDLTLIPIACGVAGALGTIENGLARAYPSALPAAIVASLLFVALGWWGTRFLRRIANAQN